MSSNKLFRTIPLLAVLALGALVHAQEAVPDNIKAAVNKADDAVAAIIAVPDDKRTYDNTLGALDDMNDRLQVDVAMFTFMQFVSTDAKVRDESRAADEFVSNWGSALLKNEDLYKAIKAYADTNPTLDPEKHRLLVFTLRDFRRSGMALSKDKRDRLQEIDNQIQKLGQDFQKNIFDDETRVAFTKAELPGVPADGLGEFQQSDGLYLLDIAEPTYDLIESNCTNETSRQKFWLAFKRRGGQANVDILEKLIKLRAEEATIMGFKTWADYVAEPRMAKNQETIAKFYANLRPVVRKKALVDWALFSSTKQQDTHNPKAIFRPWDYTYYNTFLKKKKYAVDPNKVAEYFPAERVVKGMFDVTSRLYNISFKDVTADADKLGMPIWYKDVKLYEVDDNKTHQVLGHFFTDLYPRPNKYSHAACWGLIPRKVWADGTVQKPVAALVCNLARSTATKPSLLPHSDVETIFHEFGHGLHNLLTEATTAQFSGTAVERDFVEAPSQMMENWVWEPSVLKLFARHYKTGQPLPQKLLDGMLAARSLGSGMTTEHQIYYGMVDQIYHTAPGGKVDTTKVGIDEMHRIELYQGVPGSMFQASFEHLVGYDAAYYSYLWSLVYAQDMFQRFKQLGVLSPSTGAYYREKVLSKGGTEDAFVMLKNYLGRAPKPDAFLNYLGLTAQTAKPKKK